MSDTLVNALQSQGRSSSVLGAIANPTVVNPLADYSGAAQLASNIVGLRQKQFDLQQAQLQPAYQAMRQVMATNSDPSWDDVTNALAQSARIGGNVDGLVANANETMARGGKPGDFIRAYGMGGMTPWEQGQLAGPRQQGFETGAGTVYGTMGGPWSANAGQFTPGGFIQGGLSPAQAATFQTVTGPDGRQYQVPMGTLFGSGAPGGGGGQGSMPIAGGGGGGGGGLPPQSTAPTASLGATDQADFVQKFTPIAQDISQRTGLPTSYVLAQAGLETGWGTSRAAGNNNFFGISPGGQLASYGTPQAGADAYVALMNSPRYANVARTGSPAQIGTAMAAAGYNPNPNYGTSVGNFASALPAQGGGGGGSGGRPPTSGAFIGATSAQPVSGGGGNVQPAGGSGGMQYFSPTGQPVSPGSGGGFQLPGVARTPGGAPVLTPPAPWMGPLWEQSAKQYSADVDKEGGLAQRIQPWQSALSILKANPNLTTGPTSSQWSAWASTLQQYGVTLPSMPADSVTAYQELGKNLARGLAASGAASSPTDLARLQTEASMPSTQMTPDTIRQLVARQIGYERFQVARLGYFRSLHPGEDPDQYANQYRSQTNQWASSMDPVAFGADNMTPADITTYRKGLTPQQDDKFLRSITQANRLYPEITPGGQ